MDPEVCLKAAEDAWDDGELAQCLYHLHDYAEWAFKGGFHANEGSQRFISLLNTIGDHCDDGKIIVRDPDLC